jgi:transcriptional regulator with XRE-family HTH domain
MQEKISNFAILFISRLKSALKISTDLELAAYLGVNQSTLSSWKIRNSIDFDRIIAKCNNIRMDHLIDGSLPVYKSESPNFVEEPRPVNNNSCKLCKEKDKMIELLNYNVNIQHKLINNLEATLESIKKEKGSN